jgi:hypothetical protein
MGARPLFSETVNKRSPETRVLHNGGEQITVRPSLLRGDFDEASLAIRYRWMRAHPGEVVVLVV